MKHLASLLATMVLLGRAPIAAAAPPAAEPLGGRAAPLPPAVRDVDIEEHLGKPIRTDLSFTDMDGKPVRLSDYVKGDKPVLLILAYYRCPMLCGLVLRGMVDGLRKLSWTAGDEFRALTVSFDPRDTPAAAAQKRASTLTAAKLDGRADTWPFLVGREPEIRALADDLGFRFAYDPQTDQYAHPAAAFVLTPDGRISRYLYGTDFSPRDLRLSLTEAGEGRTGTIVDRVILTCYHYDPTTRRYGPFIAGFLRLGAVIILATVTTMLAVLWRGERRRRLAERSAR